jgi:hypothetical protein
MNTKFPKKLILRLFIIIYIHLKMDSKQKKHYEDLLIKIKEVKTEEEKLKHRALLAQWLVDNSSFHMGRCGICIKCGRDVCCGNSYLCGHC